MTNAMTQKAVIELISSLGDMSVADIKPEMTLDDAGFDSLSGVELMMAIEEEMLIQIPDADAEKISGLACTVQTVLDYVESRQPK